MPPKLTFGYLCDFRNPPQWHRPSANLYAEILDFISWSETVGFEGAWVPEHHGAEDGYMPSPLVALAAIAARTKRIRIGSAIALAPLYHPVRFAEECAVLDILSNGRLEMALAIGYRRRETEAYGVDFSKRGSQFDEFLEIVRKLWAGATVSFEGRHYTVNNAAIMPQSPRGQIPLYIGGFAEKALARVAKYADGYFGNEDVCGLYADKLREEGKDPAEARIRIQGLFLTVARDPQTAMDELAPYFHHVNNTYGQWLNEDKASGIDDVALKPMSLEAFKTSGILKILTPEQAIDHFRAMQARIPVEHFMMMLPPGLPPARFMPYAELFANEVIPAFR
ncbi:LLM class flavin-dependent oxidoreductase [Sphingomonas sp. LaA6.9]|uniref:LLM class flavin-dependent oxidoreductase n=1 Tax=Sphingomonas sp. LaA6.9 TaxID=2919914 RepID=UPI001F4F75F2|nr:LLM class flavin-dependent oxidoreductase [Sphingomonas sp. LaA6.9]MCJ8156108.1 LLM class flavin-dependent oxidoreductase [Sphingomonas sp. LaA6.9]